MSLLSAASETPVGEELVVPEERKLVSIITPAYNESECIDELARQLTLVMDAEPAYDFEVIVVENGSVDDTWVKLLAIRGNDPRFKIIKLARNFRMDGGLTAGLQHASGDAAVLMTADLQDPPELIPAFLRKWEQGYENVYMTVTERQGTGALRRFNSEAFYWLAGKLTGGALPKNASDYRLVDRRVYQTINTMDERNRFVRGLFAWVGFDSVGIEHERPPRFGGESKAHSLKVFDLASKGILAHSYVPLRMITATGLVISLVSLIALLFSVVQFVFFGVPFAGYGTLLGLMLLMFGLLFLFLGVISEYIGLIYEEVKHRPNYVVSRLEGL